MFPSNAYNNMAGYSYGAQPYGQVQPAPMPQLNNFSNQQQQPPQPKQPVSLFGRVVGSVDEVTAGDVPNNGTIALFPQQDYSCIFAKQWNPDGSISTVKFVPDMPQTPKNSTDETAAPQVDLTEILDRLSDIEDLIKQQNYKPYSNNHKKNYRKNDKSFDNSKFDNSTPLRTDNATCEVSE